MSRPADPDESSPPPADRGLEDPRALHPGPEGLFADPSGPTPGVGAPDGPPSETPDPGETAPGLVDPRFEAAGPDL